MEEVSMGRHLSQVDNSVEEEIVTPVQVTSNGVAHHHHTEESQVVTQESVQTSTISVTEIKSDIKIIRQDTYTVQQEDICESNTDAEHDENLKEIDHHGMEDNNKETDNGNVDEENSEEPERVEENQNEILREDDDPVVEEQDEVDDCSFTSNGLQRQNTYTVKTVELKESSGEVIEMFTEEQKLKESTGEVIERFNEEQKFVQYKFDEEEQEEPLYKEPDEHLETSEACKVLSVEKVEDQYVTAEEVRTQKHRTLNSVTEATSRGEPTIMEETSLPTSLIQEDLKAPEDGLDRTSRDVDQLLKEIRDPNLDCSLEDIEAMIDGKNVHETNRGSPEFAKAAALIDQNPDKGFDPDDPAVKGLEDWECSNLTTSFDTEESKPSKLKNVFKRMSRTEETRSLLNESLNNNNFEKQGEEDEDNISPGCFGTTLLYIFLKIFD